MGRAQVYLLVVLGGCRLGFDPVVTGDAAIGDATDAAPPCTMPATVFSSFDDSVTLCNGLGIPNTLNSVVVVAQSQLRVTAMADVSSSSGGCVGQISQPFDTGVFIEVSTPISGPSEYMTFKAHWDDGAHASILAVLPGGATLSLTTEDSTNLGGIRLDPSTRWWRMRPGDNDIVAETSPDGRQWTVFATDPRSPPARVTIELESGVFANEAAPSTARIEGINVCP